MKDSLLFVNHMVDSINNIEKYIKNFNFEEFKANQMLIDAVSRNIEIIGEAVGKIDKDFKIKYKEIPWVKIKNTRNVFIHDYFGLDIQQIYNICINDLPLLKKDLKKIIKKDS